MKYLLAPNAPIQAFAANQNELTRSKIPPPPARGRHQVGISMATSFLFRERARSRLLVPNPFECADSKVTEKCLESDRPSLHTPSPFFQRVLTAICYPIRAGAINYIDLYSLRSWV